MKSEWRGRMRIGEGYAVFLGSTGDNDVHAHHAVQLVVALGSEFALWTQRHGHSTSVVAVIGTDEPHLLVPSENSVALLYLEGESVAGRALNALAAESSPGDLDSANEQLVEIIEHSNGAAVVGLITSALGRPVSSSPDASLSALIETLSVDEFETMTMPAFAQRLGVSTSRFMHRFRALTGMPVRAYLRWRRLQLALRFVLDGNDLTDAAHRAGFADAAHFSRTFREHFGLSPSLALAAVHGSSRFVQAPGNTLS